MAMFDDDVKKQLEELLKVLKNNVNLLFFTQTFECPTCTTLHDFLEEFTGLSDKLNLTVFNFEKDKDKAEYYNVERIPAIVVLDKDDNDTGIKFYGIPGGYEINSFISTLNEVSGNNEVLSADIKERLSKINKDIHIQVFITLTCPYCPAAVAAAHKLALENKNIKADMVESSTFPQLAIKYNVQGVPKTIINETTELVGANPIENIVAVIEKM